MKCFFILFLICFSFLGYSQNSKRDLSISLGTGLDLISFRDLSSSPLAYSGFGAPFVVRVNFGSEKTIHQLNIGLISEAITNNYPLTSNVNTQLLTWDKTDFQYSFLHRIKSTSHFVGGSLEALFFFREYDFLDGQSYEFLGSLNVDYLRKVPVTKKYRIITRVALPLIGYINRKPSLTLDEAFLDDFHNGGNLSKYGKWKTIFDNWFRFSLSAMNEFKLNEKVSLILEFGIEYYSIDFPEKVTNINYPIICHVNFHF